MTDILSEMRDAAYEEERRPKTLAETFAEWHEKNPHVYALFVRFALQAAERRPYFSARTVLHRIRWHTTVETVGDDYKVSNNWSPFFARMFERDHPEHKGFFRMRDSAADGTIEMPI